MSKYEKIAEWIISQNVNRVLRTKDIKEIAETLFDTKLTNRGVQLVKEALLDRDYTNIKDGIFEGSTRNLFEPVIDCIYKNWLTIYSDEYIWKNDIEVQNDNYNSNKIDEANFVYIKFSGSRKEMFLRPYDYEEFYKELKQIKIEGWKLKSISKRKVRPKFRPGEEFYEISLFIYQRYSKLKDSDSYNENEIITKTIYMDRYDLLDSHVQDVAKNNGVKLKLARGKNRYKITGTKEDIEWFVKRLSQTSDTYIIDSNIKDSQKDLILSKIKPQLKALEDLDKDLPQDNYSKQSRKDFIETVYRTFAKELRPYGDFSKKYIYSSLQGNLAPWYEDTLKYNEIAPMEWRTEIINRIEYLFNKYTSNNIKDAKLTHKQKLWYAEELEKFIKPEYLRRNYTLRKMKRRRK